MPLKNNDEFELAIFVWLSLFGYPQNFFQKKICSVVFPLYVFVVYIDELIVAEVKKLEGEAREESPIHDEDVEKVGVLHRNKKPESREDHYNFEKNYRYDIELRD